MKKILLLLLCTVVSFGAIAQNNKNRNSSKNKADQKTSVEFLGVDFSNVNVVGTDENASEFLEAFEGINVLMISESSKYDVGKYLKLNVTYTNVSEANKQLRKLKGEDFLNVRKPKFDVASVISNYPKLDGNMLLIVAKELNKKGGVGEFVAVVFDGMSKKIISQTSIQGKPKGFGLRNYWAGSLLNALKKVK